MSQHQNVRVQKQVRVIESRLDKSYVRFNSILAENTKLRDLINHLRRERGVFEGLSKRLEKVTLLVFTICYYSHSCFGKFDNFVSLIKLI